MNTIHSDYIKSLEVINKNIKSFNSYLCPTNEIPLIDMDNVHNNEYFTCLLNIPWLELKFPNAEQNGIYFILGCNANEPDKRAIYIGKASFTSTIGLRLYSHLSKDKDNENYTMKDIDGNVYNLEYVFGLDLKSLDLSFFASSLEEYLIQNLKTDVHLLNSIGNYY